jgi:hypothetical protein
MKSTIGRPLSGRPELSLYSQFTKHTSVNQMTVSAAPISRAK